MKKSVIHLSLFLGATFSACVVMATMNVSHAESNDLIHGNVQAGKAKSAACVACHGVDGNSILSINPTLAGQHQRYLFKQLREFKLGAQTNGEKGRYAAAMSAMAMPLSEQDMADLAAYYSSQKAKAGTTVEDVIEIAQPLYRAGDKSRGIPACIACHGPRGSGTSLSGFPKISGQHAQYINAQLMAFKQGKRHNDLNDMMRSVARKLSDDEIDALSEYVGGLH